jgi:hypothetical protein
MSNQGWECPKCGRVYAPHVDQCSACAPETKMPTTLPAFAWCNQCRALKPVGHVCAMPLRVASPVEFKPWWGVSCPVCGKVNDGIHVCGGPWGLRAVYSDNTQAYRDGTLSWH